MALECQELTVQLDPEKDRGSVSALFLEAQEPWCLYVVAHGAGAGMRHASLESFCQRCASAGIATLRYQFPYMEAGRGRPDFPPVAHRAVRSAVRKAAELRPDLPLLAGGRSFGGRMTSQAQAKLPLPGVRGLAFLAFPLHPPKKPGIERAEHLDDIEIPMLFLVGTRDRLSQLDLLDKATRPLRKRAKVHIIEGADHGFSVLKRSGRTTEEAESELVAELASWAKSL